MKASHLKPSIKLEEGESLQLTIRRSPIILILIVAGEFIALAFFITFLIYYNHPPRSVQPYLILDDFGRKAIFLIACVLYAALLIVGLVKIHLHRVNILFVTNRRIIQQSVPSLLSNSLNVIDLVSTEDVSFHQAGIFDHIFKLGKLRISTVGDETTYIFDRVDTPTNEVEIISSLISKVKPGHRRARLQDSQVTQPEL